MKRAQRVLCCLAAVTSMGALGGCGPVMDTILPAPTPEPTPPPMELPKGEVFSASDYVTRGDTQPGLYRIVAIPAGNLVTVQTVVTTKDTAGHESYSYGVTETVRLAGIETVPRGKPGFAETVATIQHWTLGRNDLQVDIDPKFPWDLHERRMAQIYFTPTSGPLANQVLNLNRMLVRSGYAVVDLNEATSIDLQKWLYDEVYARGHTVDGTAKGTPQPLGLWGLGIIIGNRPAPALFSAKPAAVGAAGAGKGATHAGAAAASTPATELPPVVGSRPLPGASSSPVGGRRGRHRRSSGGHRPAAAP